MSPWSFLDLFLLYFHLILTLFNLLGWIWIKTRRAHLISVSLTLFSWLGLGLFFGLGYCPLTDLHWYVRAKLGKTDMPPSYIKFVIDYFTGWDVNPQVVDLAAAVSLGIAFCLAVYLGVRSPRNKKNPPLR